MYTEGANSINYLRTINVFLMSTISQQENWDISSKWVNEFEKFKELEKDIPILEFGEKIDHRHLAVQFDIIEYMTQTKEHLNKLYKHPVQFSYNRYNNLLPCEFSMVRIQDNMAGMDEPDAYINANYIETALGKKIIATQGPLLNTIKNFWRMVHDESVSVLFMLCNLEERGTAKCSKYWPCKEDPVIIQHNGKPLFRLELVEETEVKEKLFCRKIRMVGNSGQRIITHYKWEQWKDNEAPPPGKHEVLSGLLNIARDSLNEGQGVLVHCSAGVGRTGTFIALLNLTTILKAQSELWREGKPLTTGISIFGTVRRLREQRWGMVFVKTQYRFLYEFLDSYIRKEFELDDHKF